MSGWGYISDTTLCLASPHAVGIGISLCVYACISLRLCRCLFGSVTVHNSGVTQSRGGEVWDRMGAGRASKFEALDLCLPTHHNLSKNDCMRYETQAALWWRQAVEMNDNARFSLLRVRSHKMFSFRWLAAISALKLHWTSEQSAKTRRSSSVRRFRFDLAHE